MSAVLDQVEEAESTEQRFITPELLPLWGVENNCLALPGGNFAGVIRMQGVNALLMSAIEKRAYVRRMESLFNAASGPFAFYCSIRPHQLEAEMQEIEQQLHHEKNPALWQQYHVQADHLKRLSGEHNLTRRHYYATVQVKAAEVTTDEEQKTGFGQRVKQNFLTAFGSAPGENQPDKTGRELVPAQVAGQARFRAGSFADGARVLENEEIIRLLADLCASPDQGTTNLSRIGGAPFEEYPDYLKLGKTYIACLYITEFPR